VRLGSNSCIHSSINFDSAALFRACCCTREFRICTDWSKCDSHEEMGAADVVHVGLTWPSAARHLHRRSPTSHPGLCKGRRGRWRPKRWLGLRRPARPGRCVGHRAHGQEFNEILAVLFAADFQRLLASIQRLEQGRPARLLCERG